MKIRDGKYILGNKRQIERALADKNDEIRELKNKLGAIHDHADAMLDLHMPRISGALDLSICPSEERKDELLRKIGNNLWCTECSTRWPCASIDTLKELRDYARGRLSEAGQVAFESRALTMEPKKREGLLPVQVHL